MIILALDPAEYRVGWALGEAGSKPMVDVLKLRKGNDRTEDAAEKFAKWLHQMMAQDKIGLLCVEHFLPSGAMKGRTTDATREGQIGLAYTARAVAAINGVPYRSPEVQTIRKHFLGVPTMGDSASTKAAVIKQAQLLGYIPKDCVEDNMGDACAVFDFASSHYCSKAAAFMLTA